MRSAMHRVSRKAGEAAIIASRRDAHSLSPLGANLQKRPITQQRTASEALPPPLPRYTMPSKGELHRTLPTSLWRRERTKVSANINQASKQSATLALRNYSSQLQNAPKIRACSQQVSWILTHLFVCGTQAMQRGEKSLSLFATDAYGFRV
jgi:hypothetical protein